MNFKDRSLKFKIIVFSLVTALVPLAIFTWRMEVVFYDQEEEGARTFQSHAVSLIDTIERNLFERYGDVQAFSANELARNTSLWNQPDADDNSLIRAINTYVDLYDIYDAMIIVDMKGKPVAVNTRDVDGNPVQTAWIYNQNFSQAKWFIDSKNKNFLKGSGTNGTVVEDVHVDSIVQRLRGDNGLAISYSTPIYDENGEMIAVWNNRVSMNLINQICQDFYESLAETGYGTAELTILDHRGRVIVDLDPTVNGSVNEANEDMNVLLNLNLADLGVEAAVQAVKGERGGNYSFHKRKNIWQTAGYAHSVGALGYKGLDWSALVRINKSESLASVIAARFEIIVIIGVSSIFVLFGSFFVSRSITKPIEGIASQVMDNVELNRTSSNVVDENSHKLATGASSQAASVEQTSASLEELSSMTAQNAESVIIAKNGMDEAKSVVKEINTMVEALKSSMKGISDASEETQKIIRTIDEIAFQTNILALNAAVEAARAGEAGAGFAVVADEVRSLAGRAAEAAQSTAGLIESNINKIEEGVYSVDKTDDGFKKLQAKTDEIATSVDQIASASEQQKVGLGQISDALGNISNVTISNASTAEEAAAASKEMSAQANSMGVLANKLNSIVEGRLSSNQNSERSPVAKYSPPITSQSNRVSKAVEEDVELWN